MRNTRLCNWQKFMPGKKQFKNILERFMSLCIGCEIIYYVCIRLHILRATEILPTTFKWFSLKGDAKTIEHKFEYFAI